MEPLQALALILILWVVAVSLIRRLHLERYGLKAHPLYIIYRSQRLNNFLIKVASWNPLFWRTFGDISVAMSFGQMAFLGWLLVKNLLQFLIEPSAASPMIPIIPGITVRLQSIPYFLVSVSLTILLHELSHGVLCATEDVKVKNSALLLSFVFFGGGVQPDEEEMKRTEGMGRMRIYAVGSLTNLILGFFVLFLDLLLRGRLPPHLSMTLQWIHFISINAAVINMLPLYPFDGDGVLNVFFKGLDKRGETLRRITGSGFLALLILNMVMSFTNFGLISF